MEKKKYLVPDVVIVPFSSELMEVIEASPTPMDPEAKKANEFIEEEEPLPIDKNIWEDDEE